MPGAGFWIITLKRPLVAARCWCCAGTEERRADALRPGEFVFVGSMKRELKKVTHRKERWGGWLRLGPRAL